MALCVHKKIISSSFLVKGVRVFLRAGRGAVGRLDDSGLRGVLTMGLTPCRGRVVASIRCLDRSSRIPVLMELITNLYDKEPSGACARLKQSYRTMSASPASSTILPPFF